MLAFLPVAIPHKFAAILVAPEVFILSSHDSSVYKNEIPICHRANKTRKKCAAPNGDRITNNLLYQPRPFFAEIPI